MADPMTSVTQLDPTTDPTVDLQIDVARERRQTLQSRHSQALVKLLDERDDLRGVHALADLVADSLRWSA